MKIRISALLAQRNLQFETRDQPMEKFIACQQTGKRQAFLDQAISIQMGEETKTPGQREPSLLISSLT